MTMLGLAMLVQPVASLAKEKEPKPVELNETELAALQKREIPAGVDDGAQLRVSGEGEPGTRGGPPGDLYIVIRVKSHEFFEREGDDIYCEVPLTFVQAALGDEIEIPTLTEKVKLSVPA